MYSLSAATTGRPDDDDDEAKEAAPRLSGHQHDQERVVASSPLYEVSVNWADFLSESDMLFDWKRNESSTTGWASAVRTSTLPTNWLEGLALGNGLLGSIIYFCDPPPAAEGTTPGQDSWEHGRGGYCEPGNATANAELRLELGRQDLYSARQPYTNFWNGIRLPVGYLRRSRFRSDTFRTCWALCHFMPACVSTGMPTTQYIVGIPARKRRDPQVCSVPSAGTHRYARST